LTTLLLETALCSVLRHTTVRVSLELDLEDLGRIPCSDPAFPLAGEVVGAAEEDGAAEDGEEEVEWDAEADMVAETPTARKKLASQAPKANKPRASAKARVKPEKEKRITRKAHALKVVVAVEDIMVMEEVDPVDSEAEEDGDITAVMVMDRTDTEDLLPIHSELRRIVPLLLI
jgi:hypothetical protein